MQARVGTVSTEIVLDSGDNGGLLTITHEPLGDDPGTGPETRYTFHDRDCREVARGKYLATDRQDGELAMMFFAGCQQPNLDTVAAVARAVRRAATALSQVAATA